jgi:protein-disulfide isomerase
MTFSKKNITIVIVLAAIGTIILLKILLFSSTGNVDAVAARTKGPENAKIDIVEFIDFECPACAYGTQKLKEYMAQYPNSIHLQVRYYPLMNIHHHALEAASYVECVARQGKFWQFFDPLMSSQEQWARLVNVEGVFDQMAQQAGADLGQIKNCLSSGDVSVKIMAEKAIGRSMGVQSTPTYFINKKMVVGSKSLVDELNNYFPKTKQ